MRKSVLYFGLLIGIAQNSLAQSNTTEPAGHQSPVGVQSPNAASLGAFGAISISQFTGAPNIELPLYTAQHGSISIPVKLRYNASGFRPDEHPGWVGMGWSLSAGGVVTRTVNRVPDEFMVPQSSTRAEFPALGYYYSNEILAPSNWGTESFLKSLASRTPDAGNNYTYLDSEPDEFSFTLPTGVSGSFYKAADGNGTTAGRGKWQVRCDQPVKVDVNNVANPLLTVPFVTPNGPWVTNYASQYPKMFAGFTVTTADGTRYVFGHDEGAGAPADRPAIEYSINIFDQRNDFWTANAWYLTKVISAAGDQATLTYEREAVEQRSVGTAGRFVSQMYNHINDELLVQSDNGGGFFTTNTCTNRVTATNIPKAIVGKLVAPVYLRSIQAGLGEVQFDRSFSTELRCIPTASGFGAYDKFSPLSNGADGLGSTSYPFLEAKWLNTGKVSFTNSVNRMQWQKLDAIKIKAQGQVLKTYGLGYTNDLAKRLTLLSVTETGQDGLAKPPHRFDYYGNLGLSGTNTPGLPNYLMFVSDHWGFYNNITNESNSSNSTTPNFPDYGNIGAYAAMRAPNTSASVYLRGLLTRITYPTGGYSNFEYEQHQYGSQVAKLRTSLDASLTTTQTAGGVRVKKITSATVALPGPGDQTVTEYYYVSGYTPGANPAQLPSSGTLGSQIEYVYNQRQFEGVGNSSSSKYQVSTFSSQSVLPACGNSQGSHVGYSQVVEKRSDGSYSKYYFTNFAPTIDSDRNVSLDNGHFDEPPLFSLEKTPQGSMIYDQFSSRAFERGLLLQAASYSAAGQCVKRHQTTYTSYANGTATDYAKTANGRQLNICGGGLFAMQGAAYKFFTYAFLPSQETTTLFDAAGNNGVATTKISQYKTFENQTINLPAAEFTTSSTGLTQAVGYTYPFELANTPVGATNSVARAVAAMTGLYMLNSPVQVINSLNGRITGATVQTYTFPGASTTMVKPYQTWQLELSGSIADNQYSRAAFAGSGSTALLNLDSNLRLKRTCTGYDSRGNLLGLQTEGAFSTAYIWDYAKSLPVAIAQNAAPNQVAYAGFEADVNGQFVGNSYVTFNPNNWDYDPRLGLTTHLQTGRGFTGRGYYRLDGGWGVGRGNLPAGDYEVSFWAKGGLANVYVFVDQELSRYEGPANANDQDYRFVRFRMHVNQGNSVNIDAYGRQVDIDDVRLCPVAAQMTSYTHDPLVGATSTSDPANRPTFFEYDGLQRLKLARDAEGNITKHLDYHYQQ